MKELLKSIIVFALIVGFILGVTVGLFNRGRTTAQSTVTNIGGVESKASGFSVPVGSPAPSP